jgi:hypothetical protein
VSLFAVPYHAVSGKRRFWPRRLAAQDAALSRR